MLNRNYHSRDDGNEKDIKGEGRALKRMMGRSSPQGLQDVASQRASPETPVAQSPEQVIEFAALCLFD